MNGIKVLWKKEKKKTRQFLYIIYCSVYDKVKISYCIIDDIYYIERGYEHFEEKLASLGAMIEKVSSEKEIQKFTLKVS